MNHSLWNRTKNQLAVPKLEIARGFFGRLRGLLGKDRLAADEGLLIGRCRQVHMFFMKFPIDVVFVAKNHQVMHLLPGLSPWQVSPSIAGAAYVIELPAGTLDRQLFSVGDLVEVRQTDPAL